MAAPASSFITRDGSLEKVTGTAVAPARYEYGTDVGSTGDSFDYGLPYPLEFKLDASGSDYGEWTKTYTDWAGHAHKTIYADNTPSDLTDNPYTRFWFNAQNQLWKQRDLDGVITFHTFNAKGEPEYTIQALTSTAEGITSYDTLLSYLATLKSGSDRINQSQRSVVAAAGAKPDLSGPMNMSGTMVLPLERSFRAPGPPLMACRSGKRFIAILHSSGQPKPHRLRERRKSL